ncbi:uncharacterized protein LOC105703177 [Orussus abietinus]|uniref:uncharacterized protein LOC105703177 n=1 Tax=Orussus abietinus TaxID=222816 RepID=UPI00062581C8|nr:uncharacterized protein LOC105703177 [Orussus abietinus]
MPGSIDFDLVDFSGNPMENGVASIYRNMSINSNVDLTEAEAIMDICILASGGFSNCFLLVVFFHHGTMHTNTTSYLVSLFLSNLVILFGILGEVLKTFVDESYDLDLDYVAFVTFEASIVTLTIFSLDRYVVFCRRTTWVCRTLSKTSTAVKAVLFIWSLASMFSAMELHLYAQFRRETIAYVFAGSTFVFLALPTMVILSLQGLVIYEFQRPGSLMRSAKTKDIECFLLLVGLTLGFFLTMVPNRIAQAAYYVDPSIHCLAFNINVCFLAAKLSPLVMPLVCAIAWKRFRKAAKETLRDCRCRSHRDS